LDFAALAKLLIVFAAGNAIVNIVSLQAEKADEVSDGRENLFAGAMKLMRNAVFYSVLPFVLCLNSFSV
jgi:hypothetical protein